MLPPCKPALIPLFFQAYALFLLFAKLQTGFMNDFS
jgi:hypothetical protein